MRSGSSLPSVASSSVSYSMYITPRGSPFFAPPRWYMNCSRLIFPCSCTTRKCQFSWGNDWQRGKCDTQTWNSFTTWYSVALKCKLPICSTQVPNSGLVNDAATVCGKSAGAAAPRGGGNRTHVELLPGVLREGFAQLLHKVALRKASVRVRAIRVDLRSTVHPAAQPRFPRLAATLAVGAHARRGQRQRRAVRPYFLLEGISGSRRGSPRVQPPCSKPKSYCTCLWGGATDACKFVPVLAQKVLYYE